MRMRFVTILAGAALLGACSAEPQGGEQASAAPEAAEAVDPAALADSKQAAAAKGDAAAPLAVNIPRIAYVYSLGFRLPAEALAKAQHAHVAACEKLGPARCQVVELDRGTGEASYGTGSLKLRVDARLARPLLRQLEQSVGQAGGRTVSETQKGEDVSKEMVDAAARIRQRELLVARLTEILRTRQGKLSELLEAERGIAQAQEELDQSKAWLAELTTRVATSTIEIGYNATVTEGGGDSLGDTVRESATMFASGFHALLVFIIILLPWAVVIGPIMWFARWLHLRNKAREASRPSRRDWAGTDRATTDEARIKQPDA